MPEDANQDGQPNERTLGTEREKAAAALLAVDYGNPNHAALEAKFNAIEKQLFVQSGGNPEAYKYKSDVRHYFDFKVERGSNGSVVKQIATMALRPDGTPYTLLPTDEVINWRNTEAGASADEKNRRAKGRCKLDDAGHLIALEYGANPKEARNIADQNYIQNEWGGWREREKRLGEFVNSHKGCRVRVEAIYSQDQAGQRSLGWVMKAEDSNNVPLDDNIIVLNMRSHFNSRSEGAEHAAAVRKTIAENAENGFVRTQFRIV